MKQKYKESLKIAIAIVLVAVVNFVQLEVCNGNSLGMPLRYIWMNVGILVCVYAVLYAWIRRISIVLTIGSVLCTALAIGNYYVIQFRGTPISTKDLQNFATAMAVVSSYEFTLDKRVIFTAGLFFLLGIAILFGKKFFPYQKSKGWEYAKHILRSLAGSAVFFYVCFFAPWSLKPKNTFGWSWEMAYYEYGFLAESLEILEVSITMIQKPDGYSDEAAAQMLEEIKTEPVTEDQLPNIVLILNESWYDLETIVSLDTEATLTPNLASTEHAIRGYSMVPMVGTNLSEYEFLTGNSLQLMQGITPFNSLDMTGKQSVVTVLEEVGYHTTAMHPAIATNYSRNVAYGAMGFDEVLFIEDFMEEELYGERPHMLDSSAYETLIHQYEKNAGQGPQLLYLLTIQNHGGWEVNDSSLDTVKLANDFGVYREMTEEYLSCLQLTDLAWKELTDYFSQVEEPTIVCMVGDHAPSFADTLSKYWSGMTDEELAILLNSTPYIIWSNYELPMEEMGNISINYMVAAILQMAGIKTDGYYNYQNQLRKHVPILSSFNLFISETGETHSYMEETEYRKWLDTFFYLEYARISQ